MGIASQGVPVPEVTGRAKKNVLVFELCTDCDDPTPHGYIRRNEIDFPVPIPSVRSGHWLLDCMVGFHGMITPEQRESAAQQISSSGLPVEVPGDIEFVSEQAIPILWIGLTHVLTGAKKSKP